MARKPDKKPPALDYELGALVLVRVEATQESPVDGQEQRLSANFDYSDIMQDADTHFCDLLFQCGRTASADQSGVDIRATYGIAFTCGSGQSEEVVKVVAATVAWSKFSDLVSTIDSHMRTRLPPLPIYATEATRLS